MIRSRPRATTRALRGPLGVVAVAVLCGCGGAASSPGGTSASAAPLGRGSETPGTTLRLGYLPNLTHAAAIAGVQRGLFRQALGADVALTTQTFNAGTDEVTALLGGALDAAFVGPNPAINAFVKSHGDAVRIVSGATAGGAALVVRSDEGIRGPSDLGGKTIATPQLGNTQDVALRAWLARNGLHADPTGGGDVIIAPTDNAASLQLFEQRKIDGGWLPEPWASRLVDEGGGTVLVDEATQWPAGRFATTELIVATRFLDAHPVSVRRLVQGTIATTDWLNANPAQARTAVNDGIAAITQRKLGSQVIGDAWAHLSFTVDPLATALSKAASDAHSVGLLGTVNLHGILDVRILDDLLAGAGRPPVDAAGLQA